MEEIASIVGAVSGSISLLGLIWFAATWKSSVDSDRKDFRKCITDYPPAEMWTMVKTMWDVSVMEALRHRPDLASHGSGFRLKKEGIDLIPGNLKPILDRIPINPVIREDIATGYLVVKFVGLDLITAMAEETHLSLQESIAVLSTYLEMRLNNEAPIV